MFSGIANPSGDLLQQVKVKVNIEIVKQLLNMEYGSPNDSEEDYPYPCTDANADQRLGFIKRDLIR